MLNGEDGLNALVAEGIEAIVFRTLSDQPSLWESILPEQVRRLPDELARVDALLDDPAFFTPFVPFFDPRIGRPSTPMESYLRLMFLKFRYRLGYESAVPGGGRLDFLATLLPHAVRRASTAPDHADEDHQPVRRRPGRCA